MAEIAASPASMPRAEPGVPVQVARPTTLLTWLQLFQISIFWFALNATWGGFELFQQKRVLALVGEGNAGLAVGMLDALAMPIAMLTMPVAGSLSDYWVSRFGRRRPFVLVGSIGGAASFIAVALAPTFVTLLLSFLVMQLTFNIAKGPFAGLVPDVVPEEQVATASGLMGIMITMGVVGGNLIMMAGYALGDFRIPAIALAVLAGATGIGTFLLIPSGPAANPRHGRPWRAIALETFGTDILAQRDYLFLLGSRFFMLMATGFFANLSVLYMQDVFGLYEANGQGAWVLAALAALTVGFLAGTMPAARISDRVGRKPVIYTAAVVGAIGMSAVALAPAPAVAVGALGIMGLSSGAFLAVDWALMTDIIPRASAGRYMGLSNIVEASNGAIASTIGGATITIVGANLGFGLEFGARLAMALAVVAFVLGAALLVPVREPRRVARPDAA